MKILDCQFRKWKHYGSVHGTLEILVDKIDFIDEFVFKKYGNWFYAEKDGFVEVFQHEPGSRQGFADREFTLTFDNGVAETFKGSLWDPGKVNKELPEYVSVSVTAEKDVMKVGHTFYHFYMIKQKYNELMKSCRVIELNEQEAKANG